MPKRLQKFGHYLACLAALAILVAASHSGVAINATTAALYMLLAVLATAAWWGLSESIFISVAGVLVFNYFFLPPLGTFTIAEPENWVALFAFLVVAVTASQLSASAKHRAQEATARRNEIASLYELSRALLMEEGEVHVGEEGVRHSVIRAEQVLRVGSVAFFDATAKQVYGTLAMVGITVADLEEAAAQSEEIHRHGAVIIPVRMGTSVIGSLAVADGNLSPAVLESVASLLAINYERAAALQRAAAAEVARRNEEFKSSLLDGLAHDLKTPLTAIRTCVTSLIMVPPSTEQVRQELLSIIDQESVRLQDSITEAIELARIESHELKLDRERIRLEDLLVETLSELRDESPERYSVNLQEDMLLDLDRALVKRALAQVLENARKYAPPDSPIELAARRESANACVRILDRGPGIAPDDLDRVFEKFYRGKRGRDKVEGTGMGLSIARGIVEAHGGRIRAEQRPGGGAVIVFTLPLASA